MLNKIGRAHSMQSKGELARPAGSSQEWSGGGWGGVEWSGVSVVTGLTMFNTRYAYYAYYAHYAHYSHCAHCAYYAHYAYYRSVAKSLAKAHVA